ncbi:hypothetical protein ACHAW5_011372 [Stephanodiscus triporus]|uniref:DUF6824 domain-containing protein n=1 Tax=Stephanodiscus triporus TaxID=2934178 RepID=A0ABD3NDH9_9STRA
MMYHQGHHQPSDVAAQPHAISPPSSSAQQEIITVPRDRDVLNGRGQGVQRHPGNVKYRKLVYVNKVFYAKCPRSDKIKISKGIVDAVRALGGRFLELDERNGIYHDIGDKKAAEKTSQALREGQTEIRKQVYMDERKDSAGVPENCPSSDFDSYFTQNNVPSPNVEHGMSSESYFGYSLHLLQSFYGMEGIELATSGEASADTLQEMAKAATAMPASARTIIPPPPLPPHGNSVEMALALDQFPVAIQSPNQAEPIERFTNMSYDPIERFTNMSQFTFSSINSLRQLWESRRDESFTSADRETIEYIVNTEIHNLFRETQTQLENIENMTEDNLPIHEDTEVDLHYDDAEDRLSELRFTDVSNWGGTGAPASRSIEVPKYMKSSTKSLDSTMSMMSITDDRIGDSAEV